MTKAPVALPRVVIVGGGLASPTLFAASAVLLGFLTACSSLPARNAPPDLHPVLAIPSTSGTELGRLAPPFPADTGLSGAHAIRQIGRRLRAEART